jgi:hypothetical protein
MRPAADLELALVGTAFPRPTIRAARTVRTGGSAAAAALAPGKGGHGEDGNKNARCLLEERAKRLHRDPPLVRPKRHQRLPLLSKAAR